VNSDQWAVRLSHATAVRIALGTRRRGDECVAVLALLSLSVNLRSNQKQVTQMESRSMQVKTESTKERKADYPIEPLFLKRWSPRAMSGEPLTEQELMTLFEAARWAPSTRNEQEWRFLYPGVTHPTGRCFSGCSWRQTRFGVVARLCWSSYWPASSLRRMANPIPSTCSMPARLGKISLCRQRAWGL